MANHTRKYSINTNTDSLRQLKANEKSKNNKSTFWYRYYIFYYTWKISKRIQKGNIVERFEKSRNGGILNLLGKVPGPAFSVILSLMLAIFHLIIQIYFAIRRAKTFKESVDNFCKIKHYDLKPNFIVDEVRNEILRECGDEITGILGQRGIGKSSAWVLALNDHEWGRGKWIINFDDADSTKQVWLDNWASSIGYDMLSRNMKVGHMLRGILSKNIAGCCEEVTYAELIEYTENVLREVKKRGYMPSPIFDEIRAYETPSQEIKSYLPILENDIKNWLGTGEVDSRLACALIGSNRESLQNGFPELWDSKRLKLIEFRQFTNEKACEIIDKYIQLFPVLKPYEKVFKKFQLQYLGGHPYYINMVMGGVYAKILNKPCIIESKTHETNNIIKKIIVKKKEIVKNNTEKEQNRNTKIGEKTAIVEYTDKEMETIMKNIIFSIADIERKCEERSKTNEMTSFWDKSPESVIFRWAISYCFQALIDQEFKKYILKHTNFKYAPHKRHEGNRVHKELHTLTNLEYDTIFRYGLRAFPRGYVQYMVKERFLAGPTSLDSNKMVQMEEKFLKAGVLITKSCRDCIKFSSTPMRKYVEEVILRDIESEFSNWHHLVFEPNLKQILEKEGLDKIYINEENR